MTKFLHKAQQGFTLIELIVSVAIFAIVMTAVAAAYLNLINIDRQTRGTNDLVNNLSFGLDSMSRGIRTGTQYECAANPVAPNCATIPSSTFSYVNSSGQQVTYLLGTGANVGQIGECTGIIGSTCSVATATYFTDPRIKVTSLAFYVSGVGAGDTLQPRVTFTIHGTLSTGPTSTVTFTTQTTATERGIDI